MITMAILEILQYPDERLREAARPLTQVDEDVRRQLDDMLETMYDARGIGLASVQVGWPWRATVIDVSEERNEPRFLVNPEIIEREGAVESQEGCLSIPGYYDDVERAERIRYRALGRDGQPYEEEADGLLAICIQHEIDHLDGKLFIDYLSSLKRQRLYKKFLKLRKQAAEG